MKKPIKKAKVQKTASLAQDGDEGAGVETEKKEMDAIQANQMKQKITKVI